MPTTAIPNVCLTRNPAGGYTGVMYACSFTYYLSIMPTAGDPGSYVLTYTDLSTGISYIVPADGTSSCAALVFVGIALVCGTFNVTILNTALCCVESSSSGSSRSTSTSTTTTTTVQTTCCDVPLPTTLYANLFGFSSCTGIYLDGAVVPLIYDPTQPQYTWIGRIAYPGGVTTITFRCDPTRFNTFFMEINSSTVGGCTSPLREATYRFCSPVYIRFGMPMSGCCTDYVVVVVTA